MKVIWATDGSENADAALPFARRLAATDDGSLIAVHCNEILAGRAPGFPFVPEEAQLEERVRRQVEELCADGCDAKLVVLRGPVAEAAFMIADLAAETGAEVIVVGTRGRGPLAGAIGGSVTQQLLHAAPCPVAAVPGSRARGTKGKRRGWIVHA